MSVTTDQDQMTGAPLQFYEGFAWAIPTAFASALASFRFEQGDVLYDAPELYEALSSVPKGTALQVLHPPRSARATPADFEGDRRRTSWESEVILERTEFATADTRQIETTQGRLLMLLWSGDREWLEPEHESPPLPLGARDLAGRLADAAAAFDGAGTGRAKTTKGCRFFYVVDLASDASRVKSEAIQAVLSELGPVETQDLRPEGVGLVDAARFHPALLIRAHTIVGSGEDAVTKCLRKALYGGAAVVGTAEADEDGAPVDGAKNDRFSVARHGLLVELG